MISYVGRFAQNAVGAASRRPNRKNRRFLLWQNINLLMAACQMFKE